MAIQSVTLNYHGHYGYLDYDEESHAMTVVIPDGNEEAEQAVRDFLNRPHTMDVPGDDGTTYHFKQVTLDARNSWEECKQVITRLWGKTDVLVEWSMPPRMTNDL